MKKLVGLVVLAVALSFGLVTLASAAGEQSVKGALMKIEGEFYVVKDSAGKEVRLHVDKSTKLEGSFKAGDKIEATATDKGHATMIKPAK